MRLLFVFFNIEEMEYLSIKNTFEKEKEKEKEKKEKEFILNYTSSIELQNRKNAKLKTQNPYNLLYPPNTKRTKIHTSSSNPQLSSKINLKTI